MELTLKNADTQQPILLNAQQDSNWRGLDKHLEEWGKLHKEF